MARVVAIGLGEPKKGMGWFHMTQLLQNDHVEMHAVVEPWYLGAGSASPGAAAFRAFRKEVEAKWPAAKFCSSVEEVPPLDGGAATPTLAIIACRTSDNPAIFTAIVEKGVSHIMLEKPGAESAAQLEAMRDLAASKGVQVVIGYNKNVSEYVRNALSPFDTMCIAGSEAPTVTMEHSNALSRGPELETFVRGPGAEGIIHNMCCHELALAVTLFGVTSKTLSAVVIDPENSELLTFDNGQQDWVKLRFCMELCPSDTLSKPREVWLQADRCGGSFSYIHLGSASSEAKKSFRTPSPEQEARLKLEQAADPEIRPYLLLQAPDYLYMKNSLVEHMMLKKAGTPANMVDLASAVEVVRLADILAPALKDIFKKGSPWTWRKTEEHAAINGQKRKLDTGGA